jgi:uncharacterized protein (DUF2384 family)
MKKKNDSTKKNTIVKDSLENTLSESLVAYNVPKKNAPINHLPSAPIVNFTYKQFLQVVNKVPFSIKEWASFLHLSERTLQRYAQDNSTFSGIYTDRILHLEQLFDLGLQVFKSPQALYDWLVKDKLVFNKTLNASSLQTQQGITDTFNQLGRILYNVYS